MSESIVSEPPLNKFDALKNSVKRIFKERYTIEGRLKSDETKFAKINKSLTESQREDALNKLRQTAKGRVTYTIIQDAVIGTVIVGGSLFIFKNRKAILSKLRKQPGQPVGNTELPKSFTASQEGGIDAHITEQLHTALRTKDRKIEHSGDLLTLGSRLGAGGTKTVYDAELNGQHFALALPNTTDGVLIMNEKWGRALNEPEMTNRIRALGIHVNPVCEPYPVKVNSLPLTAIKMLRYRDLPYPIVDSKNRSTSTLIASILPKNFTPDGYQIIMQPALPDLATLIKAGLHIGGDSMNLCVVNGEVRPYLNDLGSASFEPFVPGRAFRDAVNYVSMLENACRNALTEEEYQGLMEFFYSPAVKSDNPQGIIQQLARQLVQMLR